MASAPQVSQCESYPRSFLNTTLVHDNPVTVATTKPIHVQYHMPEEEIR